MLSLIRERPTRQSYTWVLCSHYLEDVTTSAASSDGWVAEIEHADPQGVERADRNPVGLLKGGGSGISLCCLHQL